MVIRGGGGRVQQGRRGHGENWLDSGYSLKVETGGGGSLMDWMGVWDKEGSRGPRQGF